jgi:hypothetical protein
MPQSPVEKKKELTQSHGQRRAFFSPAGHRNIATFNQRN